MEIGLIHPSFHLFVAFFFLCLSLILCISLLFCLYWALFFYLYSFLTLPPYSAPLLTILTLHPYFAISLTLFFPLLYLFQFLFQSVQYSFSIFCLFPFFLSFFLSCLIHKSPLCNLFYFFLFLFSFNFLGHHQCFFSLSPSRSLSLSPLNLYFSSPLFHIFFLHLTFPHVSAHPIAM